MLLVEGGTLTYNTKGISSSTGDARLLLEATFGQDVHSEGSNGQRRLKVESTQTGSSTGSGGFNWVSVICKCDIDADSFCEVNKGLDCKLFDGDTLSPGETVYLFNSD